MEQPDKDKMATWQDFFATQDLPHIRDWITYTRRQGVAVYPSDQVIFRAFDLTPLDQVRVVLLGQDPYADGKADGLAFSASNAKRWPIALQRIVAEVKNDGFEVASIWRGSLDAWAKQGVLLLNTALTVQHGTSGVFAQQWQRFTRDCIDFLAIRRRPHFILWGSAAMATFHDAVKLRLDSDSVTPHPNITASTYTYSAHPAARSATPKPFKGSNPFSKANKVLAWRQRGVVDWSLR